MTALYIDHASIPDLSGKVAVVTGGSNGIGLGAVRVFLDHGALVYILDITSPPPPILSERCQYISIDLTDWASLVCAFKLITEREAGIDFAVANAGVPEDGSYLQDCLRPAPSDEADWKALAMQEPMSFGVVHVNLRGTLNFVQLAASVMRRQLGGGSIVVTTSATAYLPEQSIPLYCATKAALTTLIRTLRTTLPKYNIAISGVAPSATFSSSVPEKFTDPLLKEGLPVSSGEDVGLGIVFSATASQGTRVEVYGKDEVRTTVSADRERWNGRVIHTLGKTYTEVEEALIATRSIWWGVENEAFARAQQQVTDFR